MRLQDALRQSAAAADELPVLAPLLTLRGVGPRVAGQLAAVVDKPDASCLDLLFHWPRARIDPTPLEMLREELEGDSATLLVAIEAHHPPARRRLPWKIATRSGDAALDLVFFTNASRYLERRFPVGGHFLVHGRLTRFNDRWQVPHPEILPADAAQAGAIAVYPGGAQISQARLRRFIGRALDALQPVPEWLSRELVHRERWPLFSDAVRALHRENDPQRIAQARARLAFDELLAQQLAMGIMRRERLAGAGRANAGEGALARAAVAALPFALTGDQRRASDQILDDMRRPAAMTRLLQGDVGSGKTVVALLAMLAAAEIGRQAVIMAPTELLARQHHRTLAGIAEAVGVEMSLLVGGTAAGTRATLLERLASGRSKLVIGTHALLEPDVVFDDLGLVVIDEQHRFGVQQRLRLLDKGTGVDLLLMTATPIPRSLVLTLFGDLPVTRLAEKPAGRVPTITRTVPARRLDEVLDACARALREDARIYWICPLVEKSDELDHAAAEERALQLRKRFGKKVVGLAHGRMRAAEREAAMLDFAQGRSRLLVATTVVEVGVDVPDASVMVIEGAERYGLSQLHQLRGRIGRGDRQSSCLLVYGEPLSAVARRRLETMRAQHDGFAIAETDLDLRGPGEMLGIRQSGVPEYRIADFMNDRALMIRAHDHAHRVLEDDPDLRREEHRALELLLRLFNWEDALRTLFDARARVDPSIDTRR